MTDQDRFARFIDLQEMVVSKGYKWIQRMFDEQIKEEQETFLICDNDHDRFEKQIRLKILHQLKGWAEEEISHCKSLQKVK